MQITLNQSEVEGILANHVAVLLPSLDPEEIVNVHLGEDGSAVILVGETTLETDDTPPVVEKRTRRRRNAAEAKHVPVEAKKELEETAQTSTGGQSENSTPEPEAQGEAEVATGTEEVKEEATQQAEDAASDEVAEEAAVQEAVVEETKAAKPSLFANLKR